MLRVGRIDGGSVRTTVAGLRQKWAFSREFRSDRTRRLHLRKVFEPPFAPLLAGGRFDEGERVEARDRPMERSGDMAAPGRPCLGCVAAPLPRRSESRRGARAL